MIKMATTCITMLATAVMLPQGAAAKDATLAEAPAIYQDVVNCMKINDVIERLACYDRSVLAMETAKKTAQIFVASGAQIEEGRRGLFGLTMPSLKIFGTTPDNAQEIKEITAVIVSARETASGYVFELDDGATWAQSEILYLGTTPKKGQKITIRKAALGSFMGKLDGGVRFRIKRLNN